jgi:hypothetical protein
MSFYRVGCGFIEATTQCQEFFDGELRDHFERNHMRIELNTGSCSGTTGPIAARVAWGGFAGWFWVWGLLA